jgi:hypothetical protein
VIPVNNFLSQERKHERDRQQDYNEGPFARGRRIGWQSMSQQRGAFIAAPS